MSSIRKIRARPRCTIFPSTVRFRALVIGPMARFCENDDIRLATLRRSVSPRARKLACGLGALLLCSGILGAQTPLQIVDDVDAAKFTQHATDLAKAMKALRLGTATELEQDLKDLAEGPDKAAALKRIQQRLD